MAGPRQKRGVMVGLFDQAAPGAVSVRTLEEPNTGGRINPAGLLVQPTQPPDDTVNAIDPLVRTANITARAEPAQIPVTTETREAAQQEPMRLPWWVIVPIILAMI